jgi:N-sulfoglucosamine sulfohydrolase
LKAEGDPRALGKGAIFDTYEYVKQSPKDYATWLKTQDEIISAEAEKRSRETKAAVKKGKRTEVP